MSGLFNIMFFYRPMTKLRKVNVFTGVCYSATGLEVEGVPGGCPRYDVREVGIKGPMSLLLTPVDVGHN